MTAGESPMTDNLAVVNYRQAFGADRPEGFVIAEIVENGCTLPAWEEQGFPASELYGPLPGGVWRALASAETALRLYRADLELTPATY